MSHGLEKLGGAKLKPIEKAASNRVPNTLLFWLKYSLIPPSGSRREIESIGHLTADDAEHGWFSISALESEAEDPEGDLGEYSRQIFAPIGQAIQAAFGTIDDERGLVPEVVNALLEQRLPFRAPGYFLGMPFVQKLGETSLNQAVEAAGREHARQARNRRPMTNLEKRSTMRSAGQLRFPRPFMEKYSDGSVLIYGLAPNSDYWNLVGL